MPPLISKSVARMGSLAPVDHENATIKSSNDSDDDGEVKSQLVDAIEEEI